MNIYQKDFFSFFKVLTLAGLILFLVKGQVVAEEEYDEDTYGPEAPVVFVAPVKAVIFTHKTHTMDAGLDCDSCHDSLFAMEIGAAEQNEDYTMQSLYDGQYCGACHDGSTAFASNTRCTVCHIGVKGFDRMQGGPQADAHQSGH